MNKEKRVYDSLVEAIGWSPLVRVRSVLPDLSAALYLKLEAYNPGLSSKDRTVLYMVREALSQRTELADRPCFIEATSGNTGFSLAQICALSNYDCILTLPDKASKEKVDALRALGATVYLCPSTVMPEDPQSYYSVAARIQSEIPGSVFLNQYYNKSNIQAHYETTGPEIWEQTEGAITHFICGVGTGGTISGVARFLHEQNPDIKIVGVDAYGSVLTHYHEARELNFDYSYKYQIEGIGKNFIPANIDFPQIDRMVQVEDRESAYAARHLAESEGIMVGYSGGGVLRAIDIIQGDLQEDNLVVALLADHGMKYLSKIYNDDWMAAQGWDKRSASQTQSS